MLSAIFNWTNWVRSLVRYWKNKTDLNPGIPSYPPGTGMYLLATISFCKNVHATVLNSASLHHTKRYLINKQTILPADFPSIYWTTLVAAMKSRTTSRQRWITKHTVVMCRVSVWRHLWKARDNSKCPGRDNDENATHVHMYQDKVVKSVWA